MYIDVQNREHALFCQSWLQGLPCRAENISYFSLLPNIIPVFLTFSEFLLHWIQLCFAFCHALAKWDNWCTSQGNVGGCFSFLNPKTVQGWLLYLRGISWLPNDRWGARVRTAGNAFTDLMVRFSSCSLHASHHAHW